MKIRLRKAVSLVRGWIRAESPAALVRGWIRAESPAALVRGWIRAESPAAVRGVVPALGLAIGALFVTGCESEAHSQQTYPVRVVVHSDPGKAVAGATLQKNGRDLAITDVAGRAELRLAGREGDTVDLTLRCPQDFEAPTKSVSIRLTQRGDSNKVPEYNAVCSPAYRNVVVAVRADAGAQMPITYLGRPVAKTDDAGAAHILFRMRPGEHFELGLDTSAFPKHQPQHPKASFMASSTGDEIQRFEVRFAVDKPKLVYRRAVAQGPRRL